MAVNEINGCFHCNMLFSEPPRKNTAWFTGWVVLDEVKDHVRKLKYLFGSEIFYAFVAEGNLYILHLRGHILWPHMDAGVKLKFYMCCISVCIPQLPTFSFAPYTLRVWRAQWLVLMENHQPSLYEEIDLLYVLNLFMGQHSCCEHMELKSWQPLVEKQLLSTNE